MLILRGGPHPGIDYKLDFFSKFELIFVTAVGHGSGYLGMCFDEEKKQAKFLVSVFL
jgi:hypothetical protein